MLSAGALLVENPLRAIDSGYTFMNGGAHTVNILHTNDLHNSIRPVQVHNTIVGGLSNLQSLAKQKPSAMLLDAGDFLDSSVTMDAHTAMIDAMNETGYHVATLGNHELMRGEAYLAQLVPRMKFKLVNCNYSFSAPTLQRAVLQSYILKQGKYKIGVTGVGINVQQPGITCHHPYEKANAVAAYLKQREHCDLVICLSHLGIAKEDAINNLAFGAASKNIDLIISGHSDLIERYPRTVRNKDKSEVIISHAGKQGLIAREVIYKFDSANSLCDVRFGNYVPGRHHHVFGDAYKDLVV